MKFNNEEKNNNLVKKEENFGLFDPFFADFFDFPRANFGKMNNILKTDIKETDKQYELQIEMPGVDKQNVNLELKDGYLIVSTEHKQENEEKLENGAYIRRERSYGSSSRSYYVGKQIKEEDISASLDNGILNIIVPKQEQVETRKRIEIK